jgi:hypothetical protein
MGIARFAIAAFLLQARRAMDFFGGEIRSAIEGHQIMVQKKDKRFEGLAALELTKDIGVGGAEFWWVDVVENGAHLGIGRDVLDAEKRFEVGLIVAAFIVKGQEGRSFESEDGKARHEGVPHRNLRRSGARIGNRSESRAHEPIESIRG